MTTKSFPTSLSRMTMTGLAIVVSLGCGGCASGLVGDPAGFHYNGHPTGEGSVDPFFEGWFTRVSDGRTGRDFVVIQGIQQPQSSSERESEAFVLAHGGRTGRTIYQLTDGESFAAATDGIDVRVGGSRLSGERLRGEVVEGGNRYRWDLTLEPGGGWPVGFRHSPSGVGLGLNLESWWHVVSLSAPVTGTIQWNDESPLVLKDATGYMDKNWGTIFPKRWVWLQANRFEGSGGAAFAMAGGRTSLAGFNLPIDAFMIGFDDGKTFRQFATHRGDQIRCRAQPGRWRIEAVSGSEKLIITGLCSRESLVPLPVPTLGGFESRALQSTRGSLRIELFRARIRHRSEPTWRIDWEPVTTWLSHRAALEIGGDWSEKASAFSDETEIPLKKHTNSVYPSSVGLGWRRHKWLRQALLVNCGQLDKNNAVLRPSFRLIPSH